MQKYKKVIDHLQELMRDPRNIRNIGIIAHVDHGKTTLSDNLLSAAGMISDKMAGEMRALDYHEIEQQRGITIKAANISLYYQRDGKEFAINLVDTPGHIDFTGHVTRSLRVIDGAIVVVDSVEEVMVQTETVTRQALEERVRPLLFINKIDRLIKELKLTPQEIQQKILRIIRDFNGLIEAYGEPEFREKWKVKWDNDSVAFGSALHGWGLTNSIAAKKGIRFSDIVDIYNEDPEGLALRRDIPVHEALLDMVALHVPDPIEAQSYRVERLWRDKQDEELFNALKNCDPNGPLIMGVNAVRIDPHAGIVVTGRVFSGTLREGEDVYLINAKKKQKIQQTSIYMGPYRMRMDEIPAGNIAAVLGLTSASSGETVVADAIKDRVISGFEAIRYVTEPVVTVSVEAKNPQDLPKLIDTLRKLTLQDPNLVMIHNQETGEILLKGTGELHLEISLYEVRKAGLEFDVSEPTVVYRESVRGTSDVVLAKSPNKLNRIWVTASPLNDEVVALIREGRVNERMDSRTLAKVLREEGKMDTEDARNVWTIDEENYNLFINRTVGVQRLDEVREILRQGFMWVMKEGPLAGEPVMGVAIRLVNAMIHEDPAHRGPAQLTPAVRKAIFGAMLSANPVLLEPIYEIQVSTPPELIGSVISLISQKRGKVVGIEERGRISIVKGFIPVRETLGGFSNEMRSMTSGRAFWQTKFSHWEPLPKSLMEQVALEIRRRKGMKEELPKAEEYMDTL
ncbi:elongation factor EF-2 [Candidatus Korarchaeum cryptofilum]|uniref:Elongation factor 2 n=1 Tax=Korarchaeum cryptofilum (strain OPF8) TaxID=374847 RepID=EF2_KORCO|nr:elongation factor EF-2 [Candidatus Korarchaeum cryptofilum]B1L7Q0.1 RecName: Full=Elongation factor 2; Short=EF-2 [Candidatus Korarchaeum cryptofilum OPF8]ACB06877.1 translation elongation factor aEF-2 [Candidatus Korarchaeum cryptofilum OPF8]